MFTGIIEAQGKVVGVKQDKANTVFEIDSVLGPELKVDQSVAHSGVCLTVTSVRGTLHEVVAVKETLDKSSLSRLAVGHFVNLERCMLNNGRFDGHIVQGHVDQTGVVSSIRDNNGSWLFDFEYDPSKGNVTVEKGSVCVNGVSLTCFNSRANGFTVTIIPYTYEHTDFAQLKVGDAVNLEFDIIGKYVKKLLGGA